MIDNVRTLYGLTSSYLIILLLLVISWIAISGCRWWLSLVTRVLAVHLRWLGSHWLHVRWGLVRVCCPHRVGLRHASLHRVGLRHTSLHRVGCCRVRMLRSWITHCCLVCRISRLAVWIRHTSLIAWICIARLMYTRCLEKQILNTSLKTYN